MTESNGNAALYFVDRHRSGHSADKIAFIEAGDGGRSLAYRDLAQKSDNMADLYERHGLRPEDRAAMLVLDQIEFPVIFWGSLKAGIVPVPLNTLLSPALYDAMLKDSRARALFISAELLPAIEPVLAGNPYLRVVFVIERQTGRTGASIFERLFGGAGKQRDASFHDFAEELASASPRGAISGVAGRVRLLALFVGLNRRAKGRQACPWQPSGNRRHLCARTFSASCPMMSCSQPRRCFSPTAWEIQ